MPLQVLFQNRHGLLDTPGRMQPYTIDVGVSGLVGRELGGAAQFIECFIGPLKAGERQPERIVQPRVARRCGNRFTQHIFAFLIPSQTTIEIGEVDRRRRKFLAQMERGFVFGLGIRHEAASCVKGSERGSRLGPIGVELLGRNIFGGGALEAFTVGGRLACGRGPQRAARRP